MRDLARTLARWLPREAAREWFAPSLHDLERRWAERRLTAGRIKRAWASVLLLAGATLVFAECLRLSLPLMIARPRRRIIPQPRPPRTEYTTMFLRDLRQALRLFRREPAFCAAAVLTLALGIGANTALFAVVEAVLLRPLPFAHAERLVMLRHRDLRTGISKDFVALGDVIDLRQRQQSLDMLVAFSNIQGTLLDSGEPLRVEGLSATPDLFAALNIEPVAGRFFEPLDLREGAAPIAVISHALWSTRFGGRDDAIGQSLQMGSTRRTIVGVLPPGLRFPPEVPTDIIVPLRLPPAAPSERRTWIHAMGRMRAGVSLVRANAELAALSQQFAQEFPASNRGTQYDVLSVRDAAIGDTKRPLLLLLAAVGFVLLIACANVGNLLIARTLARQQEMALRRALGAGRWRVLQQLLAEALVLALAGGSLGVLVAWRAAPALAAIVPAATPMPGLADVSINASVLFFSFAVSLGAALLFSVIAAFGLTSATAATVSTRRMTMSAQARRAASALVAAEVALAIVLVMGAGLTLRSFANLIAVDPGFRPDRVLNVQVALPAARYNEIAPRRAFFDRAFEALRALPGVEDVGAGVVTPLTGNYWTLPLVRPERPVGRGERAPEVGWQVASAGYFRALQIPLRAGRLFDARDRPDTQSVVVVSESLAARYFSGENAVGQRVQLGNESAEIVGVVGDIRRAALSDSPRADMYLPFERSAAPSVGLFVRTTGDPLALLPAVRTTLRALEPNTLIHAPRALAEIAAESAAVARLAMRLLAGFAAIAVVLAAMGIYGVMSYSVRRRSRELGTRLALGATRRDIVALVMRQAGVIACAGVTLGVVSALAAARSLNALLFGVPPWDPLAIGAALTILVVTVAAAGYLPARRASRLDPAQTLASE
jgi:putative ABC transport system permease protein